MSELPAGWAMAPLSEISTDAAQCVPAVDQTFTYIDIGSIDREAKSISSPQVLSGKDAPSRARKKVLAGDTLVSMTRPNLNAVALVPPELDGQIASTGFDVLRPLNGIDPRWLGYLVRSEAFVNAMSDLVQGALYPAVRTKDVRSYVAPVPPSAEQTRIADQLDTLLARIKACNDHLDAIPGLLKRFRQAVIQVAATGQLTRTWRNSQDQAVPAWQVMRIKDVGRVQLGRQRAPKFHSGAHMRPYLRVQNVFENRIDLSDVMEMDFPPEDYERYQLHPGDILLNEGQSPEYLGRPAIYRGELPGACFTNTLIRFQCNPSVLPEFALTVFQHHMHSGRYVREGKITTNLAHLGAGRFANIEFPLPSLDEQREIVRLVDGFSKFAERIEARYCKIAGLAQRLAPQILGKTFRGELVEQNPNDEPASALLARLAKTPAVAVKAPRGRPRSKLANPSIPLPAVHPDWATLPSGAWAAHAQPDEHATAAQLIAVLKAWGQPMPQDQVRLTVLLCLQPRLFTAALPAHDASLWRRLVGAEAEPLPASVAALQPAVNAPWGRALGSLRARGDVVASGSGPQDTWTLGPGAEGVETAGWPDGRAAWVVAYLRAHGTEAVLPLLSQTAKDFVDARHAA